MSKMNLSQISNVPKQFASQIVRASKCQIHILNVKSKYNREKSEIRIYLKDLRFEIWI